MNLILNQMWFGIFLGIVVSSFISLVPDSVIAKIFSVNKPISGIFRACTGGIIFDVCNHGILIIAIKFYKKGMRFSQVMAFLIASPWNSFYITFILISLIGLKYTILIIFLSFIIAFVSGLICEYLLKTGKIPPNPNTLESNNTISVKQAFRQEYKDTKFNMKFFMKLFIKNTLETKGLLKWLFIGVIAFGLMKTLIPISLFQEYFGPTIFGLFMTLLFAALFEVCSEGSSPIASDFLVRAKAPGNSFAFLMGGVSTDYTEIAGLKEATGSWKMGLLLPLITLPQIIIISYILNFF